MQAISLKTTLVALGLPALLAVVPGCAADVDFVCGGDAPMCDILSVTADRRKAAGGIQVVGVEINQAVNVPLVVDNLAVEQDLPVIAGRDAIIRVHVEPTAAWQTRAITARVTLRQDGLVVGAAQADFTPNRSSEEGDLATTGNVRIDGDMLVEGLIDFEVELLEAPGASGSGSSANAHWPRSDSDGATLEVSYNVPALRMYIVPIQWDTDGSGKLPDTSPAAIERYRAAMMQVYPVADVEIEVGEPLPWNTPNLIDSVTLSAVANLRSERNIDDSQYVYGLLNTGGPLSNPVGLSGGTSMRAAIGFSYDMSGGAGDTIIHEVGHSHGLPHAPCGGAAGPDPDYPYDEGSIGAYGYDLATDTLLAPSTHVDMMTYCTPRWISDYNYEKIYQETQETWDNYGPAARVRTTSWRPIWLHTDGTVREGDVMWLPREPQGELREVEVDGAPVTGVFYGFEHADGGILYVPGQDPVDEIRLDDGVLHEVLPRLR